MNLSTTLSINVLYTVVLYKDMVLIETNLEYRSIYDCRYMYL